MTSGVRHVGRLKYHILAAGPELVVPEVEGQGQQLRNWWIRSWDWSYRELRVDDLRSVRELEELVCDAGVQLARLERRIRVETSRLVEELLLGWKALGVTTDDP